MKGCSPEHRDAHALSRETGLGVACVILLIPLLCSCTRDLSKGHDDQGEVRTRHEHCCNCQGDPSASGSSEQGAILLTSLFINVCSPSLRAFLHCTTLTKRLPPAPQ